MFARWIAATWLVASVALAQHDPRTAEAEAQFHMGEQLYEQSDYNGALAQFMRVFEMLEGHPRRVLVYFNIAACQEQLFRYSEAMANYERYLAEAPADAPRRGEVQAAIQSLRARVGTVEIATNVAAEVWLDQHRIGSAPGPVLVPVGQHAIELRANGHAAATREVNVNAGSHQSLRIDLVQSLSGLSPALFVTSAGLAVASGVVGLVLGLIALDQHSTYQTWLMNDATRYRVTEAGLASLQTTTIAADVLLGTSALFGAATIVLLFLTDWGGGGAPSAQASVSLGGGWQ